MIDPIRQVLGQCVDRRQHAEHHVELAGAQQRIVDVGDPDTIWNAMPG